MPVLVIEHWTLPFISRPLVLSLFPCPLSLPHSLSGSSDNLSFFAGHLRRAHRAERLSIPGQQGRIPVLDSGRTGLLLYYYFLV